MGGSWFVSDKAISKIVYLRLLSGGRRERLQTPETSGVLPVAADFGDVALAGPDAAVWPRILQGKPSAASNVKIVSQLRIAILLSERSLSRIIFAALESKLLAAGQNHLSQTHRGRTVLGRIAADRDRVTRFHDAFRPAIS